MNLHCCMRTYGGLVWESGQGLPMGPTDKKDKHLQLEVQNSGVPACTRPDSQHFLGTLAVSKQLRRVWQGTALLLPAIGPCFCFSM